ncbi:unnamed protein product [Malus baccata var. baccata]
MGKTGPFDLKKHFAFYVQSLPQQPSQHGDLHALRLANPFHPLLHAHAAQFWGFGVLVFGNDVVLPLNIGLPLTIIYIFCVLHLFGRKIWLLGCSALCNYGVGSCFLGRQLGFFISWKRGLDDEEDGEPLFGPVDSTIYLRNIRLDHPFSRLPYNGP